jgi:hypothetical protein
MRVLVALLILVQCTQDEPTAPLIQVSYGDGLCGHSVVLDADGQLWSETGCEASGTGFVRQRAATSDEIARVQAAFAKLPIEGKPNCAPNAVSGIGSRHLENGHIDRDWWVCPSDPVALHGTLMDAFVSLDDLIVHRTELSAGDGGADGP